MKVLPNINLITLLLCFPLTLSPKTLHLKTPTESNSLAIEKLTKDLSSLTLTIDDPVHDKQMTYECFPLKSLLKSYLAKEERKSQKVTFESIDGYKITKDISILERGTPCLAYREKGNPNDWTPYKQGKEEITFDPFFLIWKEPQSELKRPWPYQLSTISLHPEKSHSLQKPPEEYSHAQKGFTLYKNHCQKCHSLNLQGGDLGPELNVPKNITEYWDKKDILHFISNPENFRLQSKMPAFKEVLTEKEIKRIYDYLVYMKDHKKMPN